VRTCGSPAALASVRAGLDDDLHVLTQSRQEPHQPVAEEAGDAVIHEDCLALVESHELGRLQLMPRLVLCCQTLNLFQMIQVVAGERFQLHPQGDDPPLRVESGPPEVLFGGMAKKPNL
jgi:hypothetical protein